MGSALLKAWHEKTNNHFTVIDPKKQKEITKKFKNRVISFKSIDNIKSFTKYDTIIFAVKPQIVKLILNKFYGLDFKRNVLFISIIAGKKVSFYNNFLPNNNQFIRAMPNMPLLINRGMTCLFANKKVSIKNKKQANSLFDKLGKIIWLKNEKELDKVTAISGSGPAYHFFFIAILERIANKLGFNKKISKELAYQTALGSVELLMKGNSNAEQLTKKIAISGGTTEAALKIFKKNNEFKKIVNNAVRAAYKRSIQLSK